MKMDLQKLYEVDKHVRKNRTHPMEPGDLWFRV